MNTQTDTRPEVRSLPTLDMEKVEREAVAYVESKVPTDADAETRARLAANIVIKQNAAAAAVRPDLYAAVYTLETRFTLRYGANLSGALPFRSRSTLTSIRGRYSKIDAAGEFTPTENVVAVLPKLSHRYATALARAGAAEIVRDAAVEHLLAVDGLSNAAIAQIIGRDPSRVSHIKARMEVA